MRASFEPSFFKIKNPENLEISPVETAPESAQPRIYYSERKYTSFNNFLKHPDFAIFKQQFIQLIDGVAQFSSLRAQDVSPPIAPERLTVIQRDFDILKGHLFDDSDYFSSHKSLVYGTGKEYFDRLSQLLHDERIPLQKRLDVVIKLSGETVVCSGGLATGLQHAIGTLKASSSGISGSAKWLKTQMAESLTLQYVKRHHTYPDGSEVHFVNAYLDHSAGTLGLTPRKDAFAAASRRSITDSQLEECTATIRKQLTPSRLATVMADEYLSRIKEAVSAVVTDVSIAIPDEKLGPVSDAINGQKETSLDAQYGGVMFHDFIVPAASESDQYQIAKQPTLIAKRMMETLKEQKIVRYDDAVILKQDVAGEGKIMQLDSLFWRDRQGECELLTSQELCNVSPSEILETIRDTGTLKNEECISSLENVIQNVLDNSEMERLDVLPEHWLKEFATILPQLPATAEKRKSLSTQLLMLAVGFNQPSVLPLLFASGADKEVKNPDGGAPLIVAVQKGHLETLNALLDIGVDTNARCALGFTALMLAAKGGATAALKLLLARGVDTQAKLVTGHTALMLAALEGHVAALKLLLDEGAKTDIRLPNGHTALTIAVVTGHTEVIKVLLDKGADATVTLQNGRTALMCAVVAGHLEAAKILMAKGAEVNAQNLYGNTALMFCARRGDVEMLQILLAGGAVKKTRNRAGETALAIAKQEKHSPDVIALLDKSPDDKRPAGILSRVLKWALEKYQK